MCSALTKAHFDAIIRPIQAVAEESTRRSQELYSMSDTDSAFRQHKSTEQALSSSMHKSASPLEELEYIPNGLLGVGSFGRVSLVRHGGHTYALKEMQINTVVAMGQKKNVINERMCLIDMHSLPFIPRLHATYKDECCLYMVS